MSFFDKFYATALFPLMRIAFVAAAKVSPKIAAGLRLRDRDSSGNLPWLSGPEKTRPVWIHCASGEFEYAKPVIREIKKRDPKTAILVTYFSPTMAEAIAKFPGVDVATPIPWDTNADLNAFIDYHQPQCLLIARTDAWPEMVRVTHARKIPSLLFSATLTGQSGRSRGFGRWISTHVFPRLAEVYAVTNEDVEIFRSLGALKPAAKGDTRFDQVTDRLKNPKAIRDELFNEVSRLIAVAGSTWSEDEDILLPLVSEFKSQVRWIIAPHEPTDEHLRELETQLSSLQVSSQRYSSTPNWTSDVLIVDKVGILAELYQKGSIAFVGGSFRKTVHSVMEPLAAGCVTFVGPKHENNREAIAFRSLRIENSPLTCVEAVKDSVAFRERLALACETLKDRPTALASQIKSEIEKRSGATQSVVDWVFSQKP